MSTRFRYSTTTNQPKGQVEYAGRERLNKEQRHALALDACNGIDAALADGENYQLNISQWEQVYEVLTEEKSWPWENSANVRPGALFLATQLESFVAYIVNRSMIPRLFLVSGLNDEAQKRAPELERYLNTDLFKPRWPDGATWYDRLARWPHLGALYGIGYMRSVWRTTQTQQRIVTWNPRTIEIPSANLGEPPVQAPDLDEEGQPQFDKTEQLVDIDQYDDVELSDTSPRNLFTIPAAATSLEAAMAIVEVSYPYEDELMPMVNDGTLFRDAVDETLNAYAVAGTTELVSSEQPTETYTAGFQISLGQGQGTQVSQFFRNRGPIQMHTLFTRQYDLDGDGVPERNVLFVHYKSRRLLGWMRYEYFVGQWPQGSFAPLPRPDTMIGYSIIERGLTIGNEIDALRQQRLDEGSLRTSPPRWMRRGSELETDGMAWGPNKTWISDNPDDYQIYNFQPLPPETLQDMALLKQDVQEYTGLSNPMIGAMNTGRRSAAEVKQIAAAAATRLDLVVMRYRIALRERINFIFNLKKQFLTKAPSFVYQGQPFTLDPKIFNLPFQIDVAGASDPADAATRFNEYLGLYDVAMTDPAIAQDPSKRFAWMRMLLETRGLPNIDALIGTEQDAQQQKQQMLQQAMAQMQGGAPGQPGQGPQGPSAQVLGPGPAQGNNRPAANLVS